MTSLDGAVAAGFLRPQHRAIAVVEEDITTLLRRFDEYAPPRVAKWVSRGEE